MNLDAIQILILVIVVSLFSLLIVIGWQVFMTVREARRTIKKVNSFIDDLFSGGDSINKEKIVAIFQYFRSRRKHH